MASSPAQAVVLQTSLGPVIIELYSLHAPKTCHNFAELAKRGYYSGTVFHRVINEFMIQGGDPTGTGRGGTSVYGGAFEDEIVRPRAYLHPAGRTLMRERHVAPGAEVHWSWYRSCRSPPAYTSHTELDLPHGARRAG